MANIILRPDWHIADRHITPESVYRNRRHFLQQMGLTGAGLFTASALGFTARAADGTATAPAGVKSRTGAFEGEFTSWDALKS